MTAPIQVAVCGPSQCTAEEAAHAVRVGQLLAERGATVICGGGPGVMAAVATGAKGHGGLVIGILPTGDRSDACDDLSAVIVTNMGEARNAIIVRSADAVIAIGGSWGTMSEVALAMRRGDLPVVALGGWQLRDHSGTLVPGVIAASSPEDAVAKALQMVPTR